MDLREIPDWPGYWAGEDGHVYSTKTRGERPHLYGAQPHQLSEWQGKHYRSVSVSNLQQGRRGVTVTVHRMVCLAWHGPPPTPAHQVSHLNENSDDNRPGNLAWETAQQNMLRRGYAQFSGERHPRARLTDVQIEEILTLLTQGESQSAIARRYGVTPRWIGRIRDGARRPPT